MLSRKEQKTSGLPLPDEWKTKFKRLLQSSYKKECEKNQKYFDVYGFIYPDELLLIVSLLSRVNVSELPVSYSASMDIAGKQNPMDSLNNLIDSSGIFFDNVFQTKDWDEYEPEWQEAEHKKQKFYYRATRENIALTIEADKILNES